MIPDGRELIPRTPYHSMLDERDLLRRAQAFEHRALAEIHNCYYPDVYRYALYRLGSHAAAEDLASDVFERLLKALQTGKGPRDSVKGWLLRVASNAIVDIYRQRGRRAEVDLLESLPSPEPNPASTAEWKEALDETRRAIQGLTSDQQHVLALRFGEGLSVEETAEIMQKSVSAVKTLQFRALSALGRRLGTAQHG